VTRIRGTEVTIETAEITIVRRSQGISTALCAECAEAVAMITPEQAALMTCINTRAVYRLVEEGRVHHAETRAGLLLVCANSLSDAVLKRADF
jgi:hypothetical protein